MTDTDADAVTPSSNQELHTSDRTIVLRMVIFYSPPWHKLGLCGSASRVLPLSHKLLLLHIQLVDAPTLGWESKRDENGSSAM